MIAEVNLYNINFKYNSNIKALFIYNIMDVKLEKIHVSGNYFFTNY